MTDSIFSPEADSEKKAREIHKWKWRDFLTYWEKQYTKTFGKPPLLSADMRNRYRSAILKSIETHGPDILVDMIDYMFYAHKRHPEWKKPLTPGIVFGIHLTSNRINYFVTEEPENDDIETTDTTADFSEDW